MTDNPWESLTETQRRRVKLWLSGCSYSEIGRREGVRRQAARKSVTTSLKIIPALSLMRYDFRGVLGG